MRPHIHCSPRLPDRPSASRLMEISRACSPIQTGFLDSPGLSVWEAKHSLLALLSPTRWHIASMRGGIFDRPAHGLGAARLRQCDGVFPLRGVEEVVQFLFRLLSRIAVSFRRWIPPIPAILFQMNYVGCFRQTSFSCPFLQPFIANGDLIVALLPASHQRPSLGYRHVPGKSGMRGRQSAQK